jgi:phosphate transport system substrate-binding protein
LFKEFVRKGSIVLSSAVIAVSLAACGEKKDDTNASGGSESPKASTAAGTASGNLTGEIKIDGSSTVFPISMAVAEEFMKMNKGVKVTVGESGSSNGLKKLIGLEIDIADSSRKIKTEEVDQLKAKNDEAIQMPVAYDGITVVVNKKNDWAKDITIEELNKIWAKDSKVSKWSEVRAGWPDKTIKLYGPGTASGTFEYFTEVVNKKAKESRSDYTASEDDNVLVKGVSSDESALGYFGYSYYEENKEKLTAVAIKKDAAAAAVLPSIKTIEDSSYPISREIFIYPLKSALTKPHVKEFVKFYNSAEGQKLVEQAKYVKLPADKYTKNLEFVK